MILDTQRGGKEHSMQREKHIKKTGSWREYHIAGIQHEGVKEECQGMQTS